MRSQVSSKAIFDGELIELTRQNWGARYLSSFGTVYEIRPLNSLFRWTIHSPSVFKAFRLHALSDKQELLDALAWLHEHKKWLELCISRDTALGSYMVWSPKYGRF